MEALKVSLSEMMTLFQTRMSNFEAELQRNPSSSSCTENLIADFTSFKKFIMDAVGCLQRQLEALAQGLDNLEMRGRRKMLLLHGVTEQAKEDTSSVVAEVVRCHMRLTEFTVADIKRCHRMGRQTGASKPRPILCKLRDASVRDSVWFAKTKLKGTGITASEFLTRTRHQLFVTARERLGETNCWTKQGIIYVLGADGSRHRVNSLHDLNGIESVSDKAMSPNAPVLSSSPSPTPAPKKIRRAAMKNK